MRIIKCEHCGKTVVDNSHRQHKRFCSDSCRVLHRCAKAAKPFENHCRFNDGVMCEKQDCVGCGWNPKVEKRRKETIHEALCCEPER